jgi:3-deoxy-D-manno-octulosonate 8-phosphate phosphatase KdsC-like HAD superfamily phosphatase
MGDARPIAVIDIDGVVADVRHRLHHIEGRRKDWDGFFGAAADDPPHPEGIAIVQTLAADHEIVYLTGRPERLRTVTEAWLDANGIGGRLLMRGARDRRPAAQMKLEVVKQLARGRTIAMVVDDDSAVLAAMRYAGYPTFQADWERRTVKAADAIAEAQEGDGRT